MTTRIAIVLLAALTAACGPAFTDAAFQDDAGGVGDPPPPMPIRATPGLPGGGERPGRGPAARLGISRARRRAALAEVKS